MAATVEAPEAVGQIRVLSDENVGSFLLGASRETWKDTVQSLRDSGNSPTADAVTALLRSSNSSPAPGELIEIELMASTETEAQVEAIQNAFPSDIEVEHGTYSRKTQTSRKAPASKAGSAAKSGGKKKGTAKECACGCGEMTGGGTFRPGHDARHKGNLLRRIDEGGEDGEAALEELAKYPNLYDINQARERLGSGPTKKAAKAQRLQELKDRKKAESDDEDDEDVEDDVEGEDVEDVEEVVKA